ncbi:MAG: VCBS repeat-containing protein [Acidobacteria bacterium]|nr:VCBS repeat-containing protein [Acidobacteriota bacterium]
MRIRFAGRIALYSLLFTVGAIVAQTPSFKASFIPPSEVRFNKIVLDREFRSEGVAVADVDRDGRLDVIAGNLWYEAPNWTPREIQPVKQFDAAKGYSNSFINFAVDINRDGWPDQIRVDMPGTHRVVWHENPKSKNLHWPERTIFRNACNESPAFVPLLNAGKARVLVFSFDDSQMAWYEPAKDPLSEFIAHPISEKIAKDKAKDHGVYRYSHGLGVGDINGDGRNDIMIRTGYWEAPRELGQSPWKFVPTSLGEDCAQMHVYDVNADGLPDVLSSSAHGIGVWWHEQRKNAEGRIEFTTHLIDNSFSQAHALELVDLNGDGLKDLVTGKRYWAHGPKGDVNPGDPAVLVWFELRRNGKEVKWIKHEIDNDSGVGTQFVVADINKDRLPDIVTANKKGVYVFLRQR